MHHFAQRPLGLRREGAWTACRARWPPWWRQSRCHCVSRQASCAAAQKPSGPSPTATPSSPWWNPASQRERRGARVARRDDEAYWAYSNEEQRSPRGMHRRSDAAGLSPRAASARSPCRRRSRSTVDQLSLLSRSPSSRCCFAPSRQPSGLVAAAGYILP